jgi:predicted TIM-barrel fold metal-dependent hydrolase
LLAHPDEVGPRPPGGGSALSFTLEMAMAPRLGLEVSPTLVAFSEMLILPFAAMQSVVEDELCANAAFERLDAEDCPICRSTWRARCPVCSVPARAGTDSRVTGVPDGAVTEPDTHALLRAARLETSTAERPEVTTAELLAGEYPDVDFVIPHLGSFADDWNAQLTFCGLLAAWPNLFADTSGVRRFDLLEQAVRRAGPHKVLFGSDGPWLHPGLELEKIRLLRLPPEEESLILAGNFLRLTRSARSRRRPPGSPPAGPRPPPRPR